MASQSSIKKDPMLQITELMSKTDLCEYKIGSNHWVYVTHINDPSDFYVRPTMSRNYMNVVEAYENRLKRDEIREGTIVIYKSDILKQYVRGKIMLLTQEQENVMCNVFALDNGCSELVPMDELKKPSHNVSIIPQLAIHCELGLCRPLPNSGGKWSKDSIDAMKFFVGNDQAKIIIRGKTHQKLTVELYYYESSFDDIGTLLVLCDYAAFGVAPNCVSRFSAPEQRKCFFTFKKLIVGDMLHVAALCGGSLKSFYVAEINDYKQYVQEAKEFSESHECLKCLEPEDMELGQAIAAFNVTQGRYERAIIKEISKCGMKADVQFIDCGIAVEIPITKMKPVTKESYFSKPATAIFCKVNEGQMWDNRLYKYLSPGYQFNITIEEVGDKFDKSNIVSVSAIKNTTKH